MERVLGIGGVFLRAADPAALGAWYREVLGLDADAHGAWEAVGGTTAFTTFAHDSDDFGPRSQQVVLNFRVRDLDAMLAQLRAALPAGSAAVDDATQNLDGIGRFGWATDPEGNRIELWQPV